MNEPNIEHIMTEYDGLKFPALLNVSYNSESWETRIVTHYDSYIGKFVTNQGIEWRFAKAQVQPKQEDKFVHPERLIGEILIDEDGDMTHVDSYDARTGRVQLASESKEHTVEELHKESYRWVQSVFDHQTHRNLKPSKKIVSLKLTQS